MPAPPTTRAMSGNAAGTRWRASEYLKLSDIHPAHAVDWISYQLFDPSILLDRSSNARTSGSATPAEAAEACRRVARGELPWT